MFNFSTIEGINVVLEWIHGVPEAIPRSIVQVDVLNFADRFQALFVDVTCPDWISEVRVFRCISDHLYKLVVGNASGEQRLLSSPTRLKTAHPFP